MFNYEKLRERIIEKFSCNVNFAIKMKMSERTLSQKLNNIRDFKSTEIARARELLELEKIEPYFFDYNVQKIEQKEED